MSKFLVVAVVLAVAAGATSARAADVVDQSYDWSGPYMGIGAGYLWSSTDVFDNDVFEENATTKGWRIASYTGGIGRTGNMSMVWTMTLAWAT